MSTATPAGGSGSVDVSAHWSHTLSQTEYDALNNWFDEMMDEKASRVVPITKLTQKTPQKAPKNSKAASKKR